MIEGETYVRLFYSFVLESMDKFRTDHKLLPRYIVLPIGSAEILRAARNVEWNDETCPENSENFENKSPTLFGLKVCESPRIKTLCRFELY